MLKPDRNSFAIVRLIAAFSVLVSHCFFLQSGSAASEPLYTSTGYPLGAFAVQVFFVLSGILVSQSLMRAPSLIDFASARALRIFPALIVCVLAVSLLLGPALSSLSIADYCRNGARKTYLSIRPPRSRAIAKLPDE
jgi:peptidoglycan/LPS O-acetylase OafA/YrhL